MSGGRELIADLFISPDGFGSVKDSPAYFGCFGRAARQGCQALESRRRRE
jgi:hypothetical protein